mmetsp:Transcript_6007/g.9232  ORF Transcript_6007/g.9232 Transcript_6007/m.9232 type:complete len:202 (+) Transcript_6007:717-1322(+)
MTNLRGPILCDHPPCKIDLLLQKPVDSLIQDFTCLVLRDVWRQIADVQLEEFDSVSHRNGLWPAVVEKLYEGLDLLVQVTGHCLVLSHLVVTQHLLKGQEHCHGSGVGPGDDGCGVLEAQPQYGGVDDVRGEAHMLGEGLALVALELPKVEEEGNHLLGLSALDDLFLSQLCHSPRVVVLHSHWRVRCLLLTSLPSSSSAR